MGFCSLEDIGMTQTATTETGARAGREAALRMYPNNSLKEAKGEYRSLMAELVRETFQK